MSKGADSLIMNFAVLLLLTVIVSTIPLPLWGLIVLIAVIIAVAVSTVKNLFS